MQTQKAFPISLLLLFLLLLFGCKSASKHSNPIPNAAQTNSQAPTKQQESTTQQQKPGARGQEVEEVFHRFRAACHSKRWDIAYQLLGKKWRAKKSYAEFRENMEQEGYRHLIHARIDTKIYIQTHQKRWELSVSYEGGSDVYLIEQEDGDWKIVGKARKEG